MSVIRKSLNNRFTRIFLVILLSSGVLVVTNLFFVPLSGFATLATGFLFVIYLRKESLKPILHLFLSVAAVNVVYVSFAYFTGKVLCNSGAKMGICNLNNFEGVMIAQLVVTFAPLASITLIVIWKWLSNRAMPS